jgi:HD superfamily phosphohydrolase
LFGQWEADPDEYAFKVAEATVLARLGALLHDMCHISFGHSIEDDLGILEAHGRTHH